MENGAKPGLEQFEKNTSTSQIELWKEISWVDANILLIY